MEPWAMKDREQSIDPSTCNAQNSLKNVIISMFYDKAWLLINKDSSKLFKDEKLRTMLKVVYMNWYNTTKENRSVWRIWDEDSKASTHPAFITLKFAVHSTSSPDEQKLWIASSSTLGNLQCLATSHKSLDTTQCMCPDCRLYLPKRASPTPKPITIEKINPSWNVLCSIRNSESPSRPWGISVPVYESPAGVDGLERPESPPPAPVQIPASLPSQETPVKKSEGGKD